MDYIEEFTENFIKLNTGEIIPVSRNRHKQAKKIFKEYIGKKL